MLLLILLIMVQHVDWYRYKSHLNCPTRLLTEYPWYRAQEKQMPVSAVPAYDLMSQRHTDLSHLRLLAYRFMQRLQKAQIRNLELESLWQRPRVQEPVYSRLKYLVRTSRADCVTVTYLTLITLSIPFLLRFSLPLASFSSPSRSRCITRETR